MIWSYSKSLKILYNWENFKKAKKKFSRGGGLFWGWGLGSICWSCYMPIYLAVSTLFQLPDCGGKSSLLDEELWDLQNKCIMHVYIIIWIKELPVFRKKTTKIHGENTKYMEMINYLWCYFNIHMKHCVLV